MLSAVLTEQIRQIRGRIAEIGVRHADLAAHLGIHPSTLSAILRGRRTVPKEFVANVTAALDRFEAAEKAANEARTRVFQNW